MRLIDADAYLDNINASIDEATKLGIPVDRDYLWGLINYALDSAPTVDAAVNVHGRWQRVSPFVDSEECSCCRYCIPSEEFETPYCPWCGAKLDGGEKDD